MVKTTNLFFQCSKTEIITGGLSPTPPAGLKSLLGAFNKFETTSKIEIITACMGLDRSNGKPVSVKTSLKLFHVLCEQEAVLKQAMSSTDWFIWGQTKQKCTERILQ